MILRAATIDSFADSAKARGGLKRAPVLTLVRERPEVVAFVNVFLPVSVADGHYPLLPPTVLTSPVYESHCIFDYLGNVWYV